MSFHRVDTIQFQVFSTLHRISLIEFSIRLKLYDAEFTQTPVYDSLLISQLTWEPLDDAWRRLSTDLTYDPHRSKDTTLYSLSIRYIYFLLSHTLIGYNESTGVISWRDFEFLLSMLDRFELHLGYKVTVSIVYQGTNPHTGSLFVGPYISWLIRVMRIIEGTDRMRVVEHDPWDPEVNRDVAAYTHCPRDRVPGALTY